METEELNITSPRAKRMLSAQLQADMEAWLAQGHTPQEIPIGQSGAEPDKKKHLINKLKSFYRQSTVQVHGISSAAGYMGVPHQTLRKALRDGKFEDGRPLPASFKDKGQIKFAREVLDEWLEEYDDAVA